MTISQILELVFTIIPTVLSAIGVIVHFVVAHRLKCEKSILECLKTCLPEQVNEKVNFVKDREKLCSPLSDNLPSNLIADIDKITHFPSSTTSDSFKEEEIRELIKSVKELTDILKGDSQNG